MGAKSFDSHALLHFLKNHECETLYLVGDIFDGWKLNKRWYWTPACTRILNELFRKRDNGTQILFLPGNHDDDIRHIQRREKTEFKKRFGITIQNKHVHHCLNGKRFLVMHGDQFDRKIIRGPLSKWSDHAYDWFMDIMQAHTTPKVRVKDKVKRFSLAKSLSKHGSWALALINNFENLAYKTVKQRKLDGLICGHTHIPVLKAIKDITYANCGCWLRNQHTALVETLDGNLKLVDWPCSTEQPSLFDPLTHHEPQHVSLRPDSSKYTKLSNLLLHRIQTIWPVKDADKNLGLEWLEIESKDRVTLKTRLEPIQFKISTPILSARISKLQKAKI